MSKQNLDSFLTTFEASLESALTCVEDGTLFYEKIKLLEQKLLDASPELITQIEHQSLDDEQIERIKIIVLLIKKIELKSNAKLNWFTDLDKHLKRTLANEL